MEPIGRTEARLAQGEFPGFGPPPPFPEEMPWGWLKENYRPLTFIGLAVVTLVILLSN